MTVFVFILVGVGLVMAGVAGWRRWAEEENMTFKRDTPEMQERRAQLRQARRVRDRSWPV